MLEKMQLTQKLVCDHRNTHNTLTVKTMQEDRWKIYLDISSPWALGPKSLALALALSLTSLALALWLKSLGLGLDLGIQVLGIGLEPQVLVNITAWKSAFVHIR